MKITILNFIIRIISTILVLLFFLNISFAQHHANFICKNFPDQKVFLKLIKGGTLVLADSSYLKNEMLQFEFKSDAPMGLYLIKLNDSLYFDFLYHKQNIAIQLNGGVLPENIDVLKSDENKIYYQYLVYDYHYNQKSDVIYHSGNSLYSGNRMANAAKLDSLKSELRILEDNKKEFVNNLILAHPEKIITKIIKALQWPDYRQYAKLHPDSIISEFDFYKIHFFDNVNFNDTILINTPILFDITYAYLKEFVDTPSIKNYCAAVDFILQKASANKQVKQYLVNLFISSFRTSKGLEKVSAHIMNKYILPSQIKDDSLRNKLINEIIFKKELLPGDSAPDIVLPTTNHNLLRLYDVDAKAILVVFWSPDCDHCVQSLPALKKVYKKFSNKGLKIFMVSIDLDYKFWVHAIQDLEITDWIHVSDNKGMENPYIYIYHLNRTPAFYLLNENKIIFSIPTKVKEISKDLQTLLGK